MIAIGESSKKIYTIPQGEYIGLWDGETCQLYAKQNGNLVNKFETKPEKIKKKKEVIVIIEGTKAKLYERNL